MLHNLLIHKGESLSSREREMLPRQFTNPFSYIPDKFCREAALAVQQYLQGRPEWHEELQGGKMFGVLVVGTPNGELGYLAAFSGNLQGKNNHEFFVPPVCDLLAPDEFFKVGERGISALNAEIASLEESAVLMELKGRIAAVKEKFEEEIAGLKRVYKEGKAAREERRREIMEGASGEAGLLLAEITRESQFQKAEIRRAEKRYKEELEPLEMQLREWYCRIDALKRLRKEKSAALQEEIFENFTFLNAAGKEKSLLRIFREHYNDPDVLPPGGAGECAAPKLLQYAYLHGLRPISMGEFWWGDSPKGEIRRHGGFYPSCKGKCAPILGFMLYGLEIMPPVHQSSPDKQDIAVLYEDDWIVAVDKPSGILSVAGKDSAEKCVLDLLGGKDCFVVHRLDMHTSGVLVLAKTESVYKEMQRQFAGREVEKCYMAVLEGAVSGSSAGRAVKFSSACFCDSGADDSSSRASNFFVSGEISLPLAPDYAHRPCQMVDYGHGKEAVTRFEVVGNDSVSGSARTFIKFYPLTGRTHQLRVHSAHPHGLNAPIAGDLLYGHPSVPDSGSVKDSAPGRLMLHAFSVKFTHPVSGLEVKIVAPLPEEFKSGQEFSPKHILR